MPMLSVALTGNVAAGKSTVVGWWRTWGATVIEADALVREVQAPGQPVLAAISDRFGPTVLRPDGTLDRAALLADAAARGDRLVVSDIPLLFEALDPAAFDVVVLVDAPEDLRRERLIRDRGLLPDEAERLMAAQLPSGPKRARSTIVIDNDGTMEDLRAAAREAWQRLLDLAAPPT